MKLPVDACVSRLVQDALVADGHDSLWVSDWLPAAADEEVIERAKADSHVVVTLDRDIPALVFLAGATAPSVVRLTRLSTKAQVVAVRDALARHRHELAAGAIVTVSPKIVRVRRLRAAS